MMNTQDVPREGPATGPESQASQSTPSRARTRAAHSTSNYSQEAKPHNLAADCHIYLPSDYLAEYIAAAGYSTSRDHDSARGWGVDALTFGSPSERVLSAPGVSPTGERGLYVLRLPELCHTPYPVGPAQVAAALRAHPELDAVLRRPLVSVEIAADFFVPGGAVALGNQVFWAVPLQKATRHPLSLRYSSSWYWRPARRKDLPYPDWESGVHPTLPPDPRHATIRLYARHGHHLRAEETLAASRVAGDLHRAERTGGRRTLTVRRTLWHLAGLVRPVDWRFGPIFAANLLPRPALPTDEGKRALREALSYRSEQEWRARRRAEQDAERLSGYV